jgi:glycerate 2-kinase
MSADPTVARRQLRQLLDAALSATNGASLLARSSSVTDDAWIYESAGERFVFPLPRPGSNGKVVVVGAGKAAASLAAGLEALLGSRIASGAICVKYGHGHHLQRIKVFEAGHPIPDVAGVRGTQAILGCLRGRSPADSVIVVLTGGASALLVAPVAGLSLDDKAEVNRRLILSGAPIQDINVVRKHLSGVKGGQLLREVSEARFCTLVISDVLDDDCSSIGSGPTVADPSTYADALAVLRRHGVYRRIPRAALLHLERGAAGLEPETPKPKLATGLPRPLILAGNRDALTAVTRQARTLGFDEGALPMELSGDTHAAATRFAHAVRELATTRAAASHCPIVLAGGGETTLTVNGTGRGGRNQEFALVAAKELAGVKGVELLVAGTDGTDGATDAAGAFVDGETIGRARRLGLDAEAMLRNNDSHGFFQRLGDCLMTGPTGTNVMDLAIALIQPGAALTRS